MCFNIIGCGMISIRISLWAQVKAYHTPPFLRTLAFWTQNNMGSKWNYSLLFQQFLLGKKCSIVYLKIYFPPPDGRSSTAYLISLSLDFGIGKSRGLSQPRGFQVLFSEVLSFLRGIFGATSRARRRLRWPLILREQFCFCLSYILGPCTGCQWKKTHLLLKKNVS